MTFSQSTLLLALSMLLACSGKDYAPSATESAYANESENYQEVDYRSAEEKTEADDYSYTTSQATTTTTSDQMPPVTSHNQPPAPPSVYQAPKRVLIQRAESRMEVELVSQKVQRIEQLLTFYGGYLSDMNTQHMGYRNEVVMSLRIPADRFHPMLDSLRGMALRIEHESIRADDVTEEYVDIQSRLKTKKQVRDRYEDILRSKAKTVEEVLLAEEKIRRLQEEIEAQEGRLRYLADRSSLSQIQLSMYETVEPTIAASSPAWYTDFWQDTKSALGFGFGMVKNIFLGVLGLWPVLLLLGWLIYKRKKIRGFFRAAE